MIQLNTFEIEYSELTQNWSNAKLLALDSNNQVVAVAVISYATGALPQYPHASKERATNNLNAIKNYLVNNDIATGLDWLQNASFKAKRSFAELCSMPEPRFIH